MQIAGILSRRSGISIEFQILNNIGIWIQETSSQVILNLLGLTMDFAKLALAEELKKTK